MDAHSQPRSDSAEQRLERYLRQRAADGEFYIKSKFIAEEVGLTPSQIGVLLGRLQDSTSDLKIEQWAYTGATTWRITPQNDT